MIGALVIAPELGHDAAIEALTAQVGGVPLLLRQARLLRVLGVGRIVVHAPQHHVAAVRRGLVHRLALDDVDVAPYEALDQLRAHVGQRTDTAMILMRAEVAFERGAVRQIVEAAADPDGPPVAVATDLHDRTHYGLIAAHGDHWQAALATLLHTRPRPLPEHASEIELTGRRPFLGRVTDEASRAEVEELLWQGCRKPLDGIVSRNLNRHISLFISRRIAKSAITPNHVSSFTLFLGLCAAAFAAQGTYTAVLLGAALLKANSVLDGVDGELARMRVESSVLGEWLDTISDDLSNQSFFLAVGYGAWRATGSVLWMVLGLVAVTPLFLTSALYYRWLIKAGRGDVLAFDWFQEKPQVSGDTDQGLVDRVTHFLTEIFRRDSFVMMTLIAAVLGVLHWSLIVVAVAGWITFGALLARLMRRPS